MQIESARAIYEVVAGMLPGQPDPEHTRRFGITSGEWDAAREKGEAEVLLAGTVRASRRLRHVSPASLRVGSGSQLGTDRLRVALMAPMNPSDEAYAQDERYADPVLFPPEDDETLLYGEQPPGETIEDIPL
jgi:hypothetical protein